MPAKLDVLLAVRDGMPYLPYAIESVLSQSYSDFQLIIMDDGSKDETPKYLRSLQDSRISVHRLEGVGLSNALNFGLGKAKSRLIARMDADDIALRDRFSIQVQMFERNPNLVLSSVQFDRIDTEGRVISKNRDMESDAAIRFYLLFSPAFLHPGSMFVRSEVHSIGGYLPQFRYAQDYDLWTRLAVRGQMSNTSEVLMQYRVSSTSLSAQNIQNQNYEALKIASNYGSQTIPGIHQHRWQAVKRAQLGLQLSVSEIRHVANTFHKAQCYFVNKYGDDIELLRCIDLWRRKLQWKCGMESIGALPNIAKTFLWYRNKIKLYLNGRTLDGALQRSTQGKHKDSPEDTRQYLATTNINGDAISG